MFKQPILQSRPTRTPFQSSVPLYLSSPFPKEGGVIAQARRSDDGGGFGGSKGDIAFTMPKGATKGHISRLFCAFALLFSTNLALSAPPAQRSIAWVLELNDGLDHVSQVQDLKSQIAAARTGGAKIVCVEIGGKPWRLDVVQSIGEVLEASEPPAIAFIKSESGEAPLAFLVAGGRAAKGCWIETGTTLISDAAGNARELADPASIKSFETHWKKSDAHSPFAPYDALRAAMLNPALGCWLVTRSGSKPELNSGPPIAAAGPMISLSEPGAATLKLRAEDAIALNLATSIANDSRAALDAALEKMDRSKPEMRERRPVGATLISRRDRAESLLDRADKSMDEAQPHLKIKAESNEIAPGRKHEAAALARPALAAAAAAIQEAEAALKSDPEIMRLPAPGQADTGQKPGQFEARWRTKLQQAKDRLEKLQAKADKLAGA